MTTQYDWTGHHVESSADSSSWIVTHSGIRFDPLHPDSAMVYIDDIAHALGNLCRFCGHVRSFYSIAQHSVLVSRNVPPELALWGLLHDGSEAYIADMASPVKRHLADYRRAERGLEAAVAKRFCLELPEPVLVKGADVRALVTEIRDLMPACAADWGAAFGVAPFAERIEPLGPRDAKEEFLRRYYEITMAGEP